MPAVTDILILEFSFLRFRMYFHRLNKIDSSFLLWGGGRETASIFVLLDYCDHCQCCLEKQSTPISISPSPLLLINALNKWRRVNSTTAATSTGSINAIVQATALYPDRAEYLMITFLHPDSKFSMSYELVRRLWFVASSPPIGCH